MAINILNVLSPKNGLSISDSYFYHCSVHIICGYLVIVLYTINVHLLKQSLILLLQLIQTTSIVTIINSLYTQQCYYFIKNNSNSLLHESYHHTSEPRLYTLHSNLCSLCLVNAHQMIITSHFLLYMAITIFSLQQLWQLSKGGGACVLICFCWGYYPSIIIHPRVATIQGVLLLSKDSLLQKDNNALH